MLIGKATPFSPQLLTSCGCTTLLWSLPSTPLSHLRFCCRNLKIGYFSQHHVEQLDLNVSAVELLAHRFPGVLGIGVEERRPELIRAARPTLMVGGC